MLSMSMRKVLLVLFATSAVSLRATTRGTIASRRPTMMAQPQQPQQQVAAAGMMSAASVAAAAVNAAVSNSDLSAPSVDRSYVAIRATAVELDEFGLPLSYDQEAIELYWKKQGRALEQRWAEFLKYSVPFLLRIATLLVQGGSDALGENDASLAKDARIICEKLGPTFIKLAQTLSVRPDVLPPAALLELAVLQDAVEPFDNGLAMAAIEKELGGPISQFFSEISAEPVAAASLAQVYKATLLTGEEVAVKVQRPRVLETVSKDLYVLRRAVEVYQRLIDRFAPQQKTNYVALLNEWAVGFYTELDFLAEIDNQKSLRATLVENAETRVENVYIPLVYDQYCTPKIAVTEWIDGQKLSECSQDEIQRLTSIAQEAFLVQLLESGIMHADPHPGNLFKMHADDRLCILDFGLVARVDPKDQDLMVSAIIHLANKDFERLVEDFIGLEILPPNTDRGTVVPLMDKALSPYIAGGGAKQFERRVKESYGITDGGSTQAAVGGFQAMTTDALTVLNEVPFSIPPYFALLGRAIVTLEGIALTGDPDYALIQEAYPFVSRKLLSADRPALREALREALYGNKAKANKALDFNRLISLLSSALDEKAQKSNSSFIDFEASSDKNSTELFSLLLSKEPVRILLTEEIALAADVLFRQAARRNFERLARQAQPRLPIFGKFGPDLATQRGPLLTPSGLVVTSPKELVDILAPELSRDDELYALDLLELLKTTPLLDEKTREAALAGLTAAPASGGSLRSLAGTATALFASPDSSNAVVRALLVATSSSSIGTVEELIAELGPTQRAALQNSTETLTRRLVETTQMRLEPLLLQNNNNPLQELRNSFAPATASR